MTVEWTETHHRQTEWEVQAVRERAYAQGRADALAELQQWAERFAASAPGAEAAPLPERHARVVAWLVGKAVSEVGGGGHG